MTDKLLTTKELQALLQLDRVTIYKLVKDDELPAMRVGGQWRFSESVVRDWVRRRQGEPRGRNGKAPAAETGGGDSAGKLALRLPDLIPLETLQTIQNQFAHLLGVASFTLDSGGMPFVTCSRCSQFCQLVHSTEQGWAACEESWRKMAASAAQEGDGTSTCHAGIHYACAPVIVNGEQLGTVVASQFLTPDDDLEAFRRRSLETGKRIEVDGHALAEAGASLEIVRHDRALQITGLLATIANTLSSIGYQSYLLRQKLAQIAVISGSSEPPVG